MVFGGRSQIKRRLLSAIGIKIMIQESLLKMLVCPKSNGPLKQVGNELICEKSQLAYPIQDGIPVLLVEEARELQPKP